MANILYTICVCLFETKRRHRASLKFHLRKQYIVGMRYAGRGCGIATVHRSHCTRCFCCCSSPSCAHRSESSNHCTRNPFDGERVWGGANAPALFLKVCVCVRVCGCFRANKIKVMCISKANNYSPINVIPFRCASAVSRE